MAGQHPDPAVSFEPPKTVEEWLSLAYRQRHGLVLTSEGIPANLAQAMASSGVATKDALLLQKEALEAVVDRCVVSRTRVSFLADVIGLMP